MYAFVCVCVCVCVYLFVHVCKSGRKRVQQYLLECFYFCKYKVRVNSMENESQNMLTLKQFLKKILEKDLAVKIEYSETWIYGVL